MGNDTFKKLQLNQYYLKPAKRSILVVYGWRKGDPDKQPSARQVLAADAHSYGCLVDTPFDETLDPLGEQHNQLARLTHESWSIDKLTSKVHKDHFDNPFIDLMDRHLPNGFFFGYPQSFTAEAFEDKSIPENVIEREIEGDISWESGGSLFQLFMDNIGK